MKFKKPKLNRKKIISGIIVLFLFFSSYFLYFHSKKAQAAWWNDSWQYRKPIAVTNSSGGELTDFQVKVLSAVDLTLGAINDKLNISSKILNI